MSDSHENIDTQRLYRCHSDVPYQNIGANFLCYPELMTKTICVI